MVSTGEPNGGGGPRPPHECACPFDPGPCGSFAPQGGGLPTGGGCGPAGNPYGPQAGDPVNLASGREAYSPAPDLSVYNPYGPGVVWQRSFRGSQALAGYASPGFSPGWVHTYDVRLQGPATSGAWGALRLVYPNGAIETLTPELDGGGQPTGGFTTPVATPYLVRGVPGANVGEWRSVSLTWKDQTRWEFAPLSSGTYALSRIINRVRKGLVLTWRGTDRALTRISDLYTQVPLLDLSYNGDGKLALVKDTYGRQVAYTYDGSGKLQSVSQVAAAGSASLFVRWSYTYTTDSGQQLHTITVPSPTGTGTSTATINYDPAGKVASLVDANGNQRVYTYRAGSTLVEIKNPANTVVASWTQNFNAANLGTGITDADNRSTQIEFGDGQNPALPTRMVDRNGNATTYTYDSHGNILTKTSPRNITTTYTWDYAAFALGRLRRVQEGTRPPTTFSYYEPSGLVQSVSAPAPGGNGVATTSYTYDGLGNVLTITAPGNDAAPFITTTFNYSRGGRGQRVKVGQPISITNNLGQSVSLRYDDQGRVISTRDALGNTTSARYNLVGQPETIWSPATGQTGPGRAYTANTYLYPGGPLMTSTAYDEGGAPIRQVASAYGPEGELLAATGSTEPVAYFYDALYRLETLRDGKNNATTYTYDAAGHVATVQMPDGETFEFPAHDPNGNPLRRIDGNGVVTEYAYDDPESLPTDIRYPATPNLNVHFGYDEYGRRSLLRDGTGSQNYSYGNADELQSVSTNYANLPAQTITYAYNPDGSRQSMSTPAGNFSYGYDLTARPSRLTNPYNETATWTYQNNGWLWKQQLGNGALTTYTYNALGQMRELLNQNGVGDVLSQYANTAQDGVGNRTQITATIPAAPAFEGATGYRYDAKNQLLLEQSTRAGGYTNTFDYDPAGNPTTFIGAPRTYNPNNQQTGPGFVYDNNGNPTTYNNAALSFDPENHLTAHTDALRAGYTGDGLRAWKETPAGRTYFLYDGTLPVLELDATGAVTATNTFGATGLVSRREAATSVFYTFDPQGSVSQRLDDAGNVLSSHFFTAHGAAASTVPTTDPHGYKAQSGYYTDHETGLILCTWRYYDPNTGRFLTSDPIGYDGGINLYGHVDNNPVNFDDPLGMSPSTPWYKRWYDFNNGGAGTEDSVRDYALWHAWSDAPSIAAGPIPLVSEIIGYGQALLNLGVGPTGPQQRPDGTYDQGDGLYNMFCRVFEHNGKIKEYSGYATGGPINPLPNDLNPGWTPSSGTGPQVKGAPLADGGYVK